MSYDEIKKMTIVIVIWAALVCVSLVMFFYGVYVFRLLFNWFIAPLGVTEISYIHAIGLCIIPGMFIVGLSPASGKEMAIRSVVHPMFAHLIGYIAHSFMA